MKFSFILSAALLVAVAFSSCRKERTCECTNDGDTTETTIPKSTKTEAETTCSALEFDGSSCELK